VKNYNFDSQGLGFTYENYAAWRRLVTGKGTIGDAAYIVHEIAEVEELQRIRRETRFDFMKINFSTPKEFKQWNNDFKRYYRQAHSKALKAEYQFVAQQIIKVTNGTVTISVLQAAAIDPTRYISLRTNETEAARHMIVDGMIMREHNHYNSWRRRTHEVVSLGKSVQRRLGHYRKQTTLKELIRLVKNMRIK
jgi:hypothetical protein